MGPDSIIFVFWMLSVKPTFSLFSFTFIKKLFSSSSLSAIRVVSSAYRSYFNTIQPRNSNTKKPFCARQCVQRLGVGAGVVGGYRDKIRHNSGLKRLELMLGRKAFVQLKGNRSRRSTRVEDKENKARESHWDFSNLNVNMNHLEILLKYRFWFYRSGWDLRVCIANKLLENADFTCPFITLNAAIVWKTSATQQNFLQWYSVLIRITQYGSHKALWPVSSWNMTSMTEKLHSKII